MILEKEFCESENGRNEIQALVNYDQHFGSLPSYGGLTFIHRF